MASTPYRTVSDEMAWTDWSEGQAAQPATPQPAAAQNQRWIGLAVALAFVVAMLAGVIFLLPPGAA